MFFYRQLLFRCKIIEKDAEHIGVTGYIFCGFTCHPAVYQSVFVLVPVQIKYFGFQYFGLFFMSWSASALLSPVLSGPLYGQFGGHSVWLASALMVLISIPLTWQATRVRPVA